MASRRPIIILGAERSGTSVIAEMVHAWGAYMGEVGDLPLPDRQNPRGRWEWQPLWEFLAGLGEFHSGTSWWEESFDTCVTAKAESARYATSAKRLIARMERPGRPWAWKDPALCHFLGFWTRFWVDPVYIVAVRHPVDIGMSWNQFRAANGSTAVSLHCNLLRWQHMMLFVLKSVDGHPDVRFIDYERLTADPPTQANSLAAFLDQRCDIQVDQERSRRMAEVCEPGLRRNRVGHSLEAAMSSSQRALYRFLQQKVTDPGRALPGSFPMPNDWRETLIAEESAARRAP